MMIDCSCAVSSAMSVADSGAPKKEASAGPAVADEAAVADAADEVEQAADAELLALFDVLQRDQAVADTRRLAQHAANRSEQLVLQTWRQQRLERGSGLRRLRLRLWRLLQER